MFNLSAHWAELRADAIGSDDESVLVWFEGNGTEVLARFIRTYAQFGAGSQS